MMEKSGVQGIGEVERFRGSLLEAGGIYRGNFTSKRVITFQRLNVFEPEAAFSLICRVSLAGKQSGLTL
tara:strand:+ start:69 stop:275 length:207 start_codon:yes stop_codon:yes gene_type:complete